MKVFKILLAIAFLINVVLADEPKSVSIINDVVNKVKITSKLSHSDVIAIGREVDKYDHFVYGYQIMGYFLNGLGKKMDAYKYYNEALRRIPFGIAIIFYDTDSSIFIRKEDVLYNTALVSYQLSNVLAAEAFLTEAIAIANAAYRRSTRNSKAVSPRSKVYQRVQASQGVGYQPTQPCFEKIQQTITLHGRPSELPWTMDDDYEAFEPLTIAPMEAPRKDSVGTHELAEQRFPRRFKMSSVHLVPTAED